MKLQRLRDALSGHESAQRVYRASVGTAVWARLTYDRWTLASKLRASRTSRGRILAYHSVGTPQFGVNDVTPRDFERHLQIAVDAGWTFATPAEVLAEPDRKLLALTFDDGATTVLTHVAPVLRHHGIGATAFVVTGWADGGHPKGNEFLLDWRGMEALRDAGLTLASHSVTHPDFGKISTDRARSELEMSREQLRKMLDIDTDEFAIPLGQSANWTDAAAAAATEAGYTRVYAQSVNTRPAGTIARTFITRIDRPAVFRAALSGAYDNWEEWY